MSEQNDPNRAQRQAAMAAMQAAANASIADFKAHIRDHPELVEDLEVAAMGSAAPVAGLFAAMCKLIAEIDRTTSDISATPPETDTETEA